MLESQLEELRRSTLAAFASAGSLDALEEARVDALGRKGKLAQISSGFGKLTPEARGPLGKLLNSVKQDLESDYATKKERFEKAALAEQLAGEWIDVTLPSGGVRPGALHPITQIQSEIEDLFTSMGFAVLYGPEVETEEHNFDALNIPPTHPARDMQDTFWLPMAICCAPIRRPCRCAACAALKCAAAHDCAGARVSQRRSGRLARAHVLSGRRHDD